MKDVQKRDKNPLSADLKYELIKKLKIHKKV